MVYTLGGGGRSGGLFRWLLRPRQTWAMPVGNDCGHRRAAGAIENEGWKGNQWRM